MKRNVRTGNMSSRVQAGLPGRWSGRFANPVGDPAAPTRETAPLYANAPARVQHPKLNMTPWSTSFALQRKALARNTSKKAVKGLCPRWS